MRLGNFWVASQRKYALCKAISKGSPVLACRMSASAVKRIIWVSSVKRPMPSGMDKFLYASRSPPLVTFLFGQKLYWFPQRIAYGPSQESAPNALGYVASHEISAFGAGMFGWVSLARRA